MGTTHNFIMQKYILTSFDEAHRFISSFRGRKIAFDTETWDKETRRPSTTYTRIEVFGVSMCDGEKAAYVQLESFTSAEKKSFLTSFFNKLRAAELVIAHNITFDCKALLVEGFDIRSCKWFDTMIADHLCDENNPHGLKDVVVREGIASYPEANKLHTVWNDKGPLSKEFQEYGLKDSLWAWELYQRLHARLHTEGVAELFFKLEMPFLRCIVEMETTGITVDMERANSIRLDVEQEMKDLEVLMLESIDEPYQMQTSLFDTNLTIKSNINFNSTQQLCKIIYDRLGFPVEETTDSGAPSLGKVAMSKLLGKHPFIDYLDKYKKYSKVLSGFLKPLPTLVESDGRIRPSFWDHGTKTGRLSSSNPNCQQWPNPQCLKCGSDDVADGVCHSCGYDKVPDVRACLVAAPGKTLVAADFSQQETVVMAHLAQDPNLIKALTENQDLHLVNANAVFHLGIPDEALSKGHPEYKKYKEQFQGERRKGKVLSFSIPYGASEYKISDEFGVSIEEGIELMSNFFTNFPKLKEAIDSAHRSVDERGFVTNLVGRKRRFVKREVVKPWGDKVLEYSGGDYRQSFNFMIQGTSADIMRKACVYILKYSEQHPEMGIRMLATVHDEVVLECNNEFVGKVSEVVPKLMAMTTNLVVPLKADAGVGPNYSVAK